jgi:pimeloyl-ACP methyl ester carboxylesterase
MAGARDRMLAGLAVTDHPGRDDRAPALVFLHSMTFSRRTWSGVCGLLGGRYRCLAVDLPGHGDSPRASRYRTVPDIAEQVAELLDQDDVGRVVVVGNSMGGTVGVSLAEQRPDLVAGVGLVGAAVWDGEPERRGWLHTRAAAFFAPDGGVREPGPELVEQLFGAPDQQRYLMLLEDHRASADALETCLWALYAYDVAHGLAGLRMPLLSVFGSRDPYRELSTPVIRKYAARLDELVVPDGSHLLPVDKPAELAAAIDGWVTGIGRGQE